MKIIFLSLICSLLAFISLAKFDINNYSEADWKQLKLSIEEGLQEYLKQYLQEQGAPGGCIGIYYIEPIYVCSGVADMTKQTPINETMYYRIASITKTFTAVAILKLIEEGKLTLDTTISNFFPEIAIPNKEKITIYHLLHMSSGIPGYLGDYYSLEALQQEYSREELIQTAIAKGIEFEPGEGYSYSNTNYVMLGLIIEQLSGLSYAQYIENMVKNIGLQNTYEPTTSSLPEPYVRGYIQGEDKQIEISQLHPSAAFATGSMISTVEDINLWASLLFKQKKLLNSEGMAALLDFSVYMDAGLYGAGIEKYIEEKLNYALPVREMIGKAANIMGYTSIMAYATDEEVSMIVFINSENENMVTFSGASSIAANAFSVLKAIFDNFEPENNWQIFQMINGNYAIHFFIVIALLFVIFSYIKT